MLLSMSLLPLPGSIFMNVCINRHIYLCMYPHAIHISAGVTYCFFTSTDRATQHLYLTVESITLVINEQSCSEHTYTQTEMANDLIDFTTFCLYYYFFWCLGRFVTSCRF